MLSLKQVGQGGQLDGALLVKRDGEGVDNGNFQLHTDVEVVVDVPVGTDVAHQVHEEAVGHFGAHFDGRVGVRCH